MKNLKLGTKLIGGFILATLLVLTVGLLSIAQQRDLNRQVNFIAQEAFPATRIALEIQVGRVRANALAGTLLSPQADKQQREEIVKEILEFRKSYKDSAEAFSKLAVFKTVEGEWRDFLAANEKSARVNDQLLASSKMLETMDMTNPYQMFNEFAVFEIEHSLLIDKTSNYIINGVPFEGGTNDHDCRLGAWLRNMTTTNAELVMIAATIRPIHTKLHDQVTEVKRLMEQKDHDRAADVYGTQILPLSAQIFTELKRGRGEIEKATTIFTSMGALFFTEGNQSLAEADAAIDKITNKINAINATAVEDTDNTAAQGAMITIICMVVAVILSLGLGIMLTRIITGPLFKGIDMARAMAGGDLTQTMDVDQKDEIGILANTLNEMAANLRQMFSRIQSGVGNMDQASAQLSTISTEMTGQTESAAFRSGQVAAAAEEMSANQNTVAAAMEEASININMVATAAEEMNATINEIATNSAKAKTITSQAVDQSQTASQRVDELGRAADEINKVTEVITEISEQTNLLALNATIEAARAGEAGKGFAVVANEIKELAKQTADATLDIKNKIQGIQQATGVTVNEINEINEIIGDVDKIVATIAVAVEEQSTATKEIAENVSQASMGITEVNENVAQSSTAASGIATDIADVNSSANAISKASLQVKTNAGELKQISDELKAMMEQFKL
ncbi:methyl-accepting chemotaxis protein [Desulfosarcina sp. OttesenSCG-928-G10]|nr:methyl-accepting chemotaxis protein [Desulfosarcina sp. OttesenSCG-928-G10]